MARSRDVEFTEFLHARQHALARTAYLLTGNRHTAEDVLQTSLAKLYLNWPKVVDPDAYVRRILTNETTSLWRRAFRRHEVSTDRLPETGTEPAYDAELGARVWELVQSLPPRARAVVVLRYYERLSEAETADILGVSVGTVKSQTNRALGLLRAAAPEDLKEEL